MSCAGYLPTEMGAAASGPVMVRTTLEVDPSGRGGRAKVRARAVPVGLDGVPTGWLRVKVNQRKKRVELRNGRRNATFVGFARHRIAIAAR